MATFVQYRYDLFEFSPFQIADERRYRFGPFDWLGKAVFATAIPVTYVSPEFNTIRQLAVTEISLRTTSRYEGYINVTLRNTGPITLQLIILILT